MDMSSNRSLKFQERNRPTTNTERWSPRTGNIARMQTNGTALSDRSYLEDILPSYQMHNYMFNRTIFDEEDDELYDNDNLPNYASEVNTIITEHQDTHNNENSYISDREFAIDPTTNPKLILLNNTDQLPHIKAPIEVKIVLTKRQPKLGKPYERESPLTEYSPGDLVTGFFTIQSSVSSPVPFEMMLLSLEGEIRSTGLDGAIVKQPFLKMYDLSASYHVGQIFPRWHGVKKVLQKDPIDNSVIGFDSAKTVFPNVVHKKFFSFRLPHAMLDVACPDQIPEHLHMLPSYGCDESHLGFPVDSVDIDSALGYKRFGESPGFPIIVNDMCLKGQSVSYSIKVQMIGRKDVASIISPRDTIQGNNPFVVLSDERFSIRVNVSNIDDNFIVDSKESIMENSSLRTNLRTYEQLVKFEKYVVKAIAELKTRKQLILAGVSKKQEQNEIISALEADDSKKAEQLICKTNYHPEIIRGNDDHYFHYGTVELAKDVFGRSGGEVVVKATMCRDSYIKSLKIPALKTKEKTSKVKLAEEAPELKPHNSMTSVMSQMRNRSLTPLTSNSSGSTVTLTSLSTGEGTSSVEIELTFASDQNGKKLDPPTSLTVKTALKTVNIYSTNPIPINFDGEFLMDEQLLQYTLPSIKKTFTGYLNELKHLVKDVQVPRTLYNGVCALSKLLVKESYVPKFEFIEQTVNLSGKWVLDKDTQKYRANVKIPLAVNSKPLQKSTLCLPPTFESCLLNHYYMIHFHISFKKGRKYDVFKFPIKVV